VEEGKRIADRYVLARRLGRGGMGEVWLAHDEKLRREVAIKLMHPGGSTERLIREARSLAGVSQPGIVQVHDVGVYEGMPYLVMERVEGSIALTFASRHTELAVPVSRGQTYWHPESGGAWTELATWQLRGATVMCALASETLAAACVDRVSALSRARFFVRPTPGSDDLLAAVAAWLRGDAGAAAPHVRRFAAVESAWDVHLLGLVVSPILDEAGEHDLAERLDRTAIRVGDRHFNGVAAVTVRAAFRAAARGEEARAAELARRAVESLEIADVEVERLDDLRSLARSGAPWQWSSHIPIGRDMEAA